MTDLREVEALYMRAAARAVNAPRSHVSWSDGEDQYLRAHAGTTSYNEVALRLGRTRAAVARRCSDLNIRGRSKRRVQTDRADLHHFYVNGQYVRALYRGADWPEVRAEVLARDSNTCRASGCGSRVDLCVHHIVPWRFTQDNSVSNLITLCRSHHSTRPEHLWVDYEPGMETTLQSHDWLR